MQGLETLKEQEQEIVRLKRAQVPSSCLSYYHHVSSYLMCPHTSCVLILMCPHASCVLILPPCVLMLPSYYNMHWQAQQQQQHEAALQNGEGRVQNGEVEVELEREVEVEGVGA